MTNFVICQPWLAGLTNHTQRANRSLKEGERTSMTMKRDKEREIDEEKEVDEEREIES